MPRIARIVGLGLPHHITQRGNYKQEVFLDDFDRTRYLAWVQEYSVEYSLSILAYCLMNNHVHFIAIPNRKDSLAKTFNTAHMRYSQYFNRKIKSRGHLWQGRFYSCVLDENHLLAASKYVERNPVRAKLAKKPWEWIWSSALAHINNRQEGIVKLADLLKIIDMSPERWKEYISLEDNLDTIEDIRKYSISGRVLGTEIFIKKIEVSLDRKLVALPRGRPWQKLK